MTPDPSIVPQAVWVTGMTGDPWDMVRLVIVAIVAASAVLAFGVAFVGGLLMRSRF